MNRPTVKELQAILDSKEERLVVTNADGSLSTILKASLAGRPVTVEELERWMGFVTLNPDGSVRLLTPDPTLPPLDPDAPRRKMLIEIEVAEDFEKRLDNQWMVEREIHADRWNWRWANEEPNGYTAPLSV